MWRHGSLRPQCFGETGRSEGIALIPFKEFPVSIRTLLVFALTGGLALQCGRPAATSNGNAQTCAVPPPVASAAEAPIQVLKLGTMRVGTRAAFVVPAGAISITIVEQIVSAPATAVFIDAGKVPNTAAPLTITDPSGRVVFDQFQNVTDPTQALLYFASTSAGAGTVTFPDSTAGLNLVTAGLPQGNWSFVVSDLAHVCTIAQNCAPGGGNASGTYDVTVLVKPGTGSGGIPAAGSVDVTFNLTGGGINPPLSAATASTDLNLQRMLGALRMLLGRAGVTLGAVGYVDVPTAMAARISAGVHSDDTTVCGELKLLMATAPQGRQVNVFMVPGFISAGAAPGTQIAGIDGAVPGPATFSSTVNSGVAVETADLRAGQSICASATFSLSCGADRVAYLVAHEMGHFFGLYHVTEEDGTAFDPLQDTSTCPCQQCAPNPKTCADATLRPSTPHSMGVSECSQGPSCGGGDNLMFWLLDEGSVGNLTAEQERVIHANPALY